MTRRAVLSIARKRLKKRFDFSRSRLEFTRYAHQYRNKNDRLYGSTLKYSPEVPMFLLSRHPEKAVGVLPSPPQPAPRRISITEAFGLRLRKLRVEHGYTQTQLADYLGIDRSFISDVERGKKSMSLTYLETVAQGFHMTLSELTLGL